jgi:putative transposase
LFGLNRQVFYRDLKRLKTKRYKTIEIVQLVINQRKILPQIGARKLYYLLYNKLQSTRLVEISSLIFYEQTTYLLLLRELII